MAASQKKGGCEMARKKPRFPLPFLGPSLVLRISRGRTVAREMIEGVLEGRWGTPTCGLTRLSFERTASLAFDIDDPGESLEWWTRPAKLWAVVGVISEAKQFRPQKHGFRMALATDLLPNIENGCEEFGGPLGRRFLGLVSDQSHRPTKTVLEFVIHKAKARSCSR